MSAFLSEPPLTRSVSLGDVLTVLEPTGLRLASSPLGRDLAVTRTVLFEPRGRLERTPAGVLLAAGVSADAATGSRVVTLAAEHGFSAVVVKAYGDDVAPLGTVADARGIALLVVHDDVEWLSLDSHLNNALASASQVGHSVSAVAVGDLFSLAEAVADTVGGATAIEDLSQRVLAYSSREDHPIDDERRDGILGRQVPDLPENAQQYHTLYRASGSVHFPATDTGYARLAVAVRAGPEPVGSIWVVDDGRSLGEHAGQALEGAASVAALHLLRARSSEDLARQQRGEAARRLLDDTGGAAGAAAALGLDAAGPFAVLAFASADLDDGLAGVAERLLPMVALHGDTRLGPTGTVLTGGVVYVVAAGTRAGSVEALAGLAAELVTAVESSLRLRLLCGIGSVVHRAADVSAARDEAARVLTLLRRRRDLGPVAAAEEVSDQLVLAALGEAVTRDDRLVPARARAVLRFDEQHATSYARLLVVHLDELCDVGSTARQLAVHPNTVRYRLRRARELFGVDLSAPDQVLPLWLALRCTLDAVGRVSTGG